jgi:hypothetical protein
LISTTAAFGSIGRPAKECAGTLGPVHPRRLRLRRETDIRPTILALIGLKDDYAHDGRVLFEALSPNALPISLRTDATLLALLAQTYKAITAPVGELGVTTLTGIATRAAEADSATYAVLDLTTRRDAVAGKMLSP